MSDRNSNNSSSWLVARIRPQFFRLRQGFEYTVLYEINGSGSGIWVKMWTDDIKLATRFSRAEAAKRRFKTKLIPESAILSGRVPKSWWKWQDPPSLEEWSQQ